MTSIIHSDKYNIKKSLEIKSWSELRETSFLYMFDRLRITEMPNVSYLEVGTFEGASAFWVYENTAKSNILTIDIYEQKTFLANKRICEEEFGMISQVVGDSLDVLPKLVLEKQKFNVIYVDANHDYENVLSDLKNAENLLKDDGILIIDDYSENHWPGVFKAVDEWIDESWDVLLDNYMLWLRKNKC